MRCIISENTNPCFNLASEEVLLKSRTEDYFLIYRNRPSIVVGKHQNTLAEINLPYVEEKGIVVSGGSQAEELFSTTWGILILPLSLPARKGSWSTISSIQFPLFRR